MKITKRYNRWYDENNNSWLSEELATLYSPTLTGCTSCIDCGWCDNCSSCNNCSNCRYCNDCIYCKGCNGCYDCRDCNSCNYCRDCRDCISCITCIGFKSNPQRFTSSKIGSRNAQTTIYWVGKNVQVDCGCFTGNLTEFKNKVEKTHKNNKFGKQYKKLINLVEHIIKTKI